MALFCVYSVNSMYLYPARLSVVMKSFEELSDAELVKLWNAVERNVNKIKITDKDAKVISDFDYGIDRVMPAVERALDEIGVTVNYIYDDYDPFGYNNAYYTFVESFVERAVLVFTDRVKQAML